MGTPILFYFSHLSRLRALAYMCAHLLVKMDLGLIIAWRPLPFGTEGSFCTCVVGVSLTLRKGTMRPLDLLSKQDLAPLCPYHYHCLKRPQTGVPLVAQWLTSPTSIHEDGGFDPWSPSVG